MPTYFICFNRNLYKYIILNVPLGQAEIRFECIKIEKDCYLSNVIQMVQNGTFERLRVFWFSLNISPRLKNKQIKRLFLKIKFLFVTSSNSIILDQTAFLHPNLTDFWFEYRKCVAHFIFSQISLKYVLNRNLSMTMPYDAIYGGNSNELTVNQKRRSSKMDFNQVESPYFVYNRKSLK